MMALAAAFLTALLLTLWLASDKSPLIILDAPNERSLHEHPTPRTGGLAMLVAIATGWLLLVYLNSWPDAMIWVAGAALLVAAVSLLDDLKELPPLLRISVHAVAATLLIVGNLSLAGVIGAVISWFGIVWMLNLYNFMDGMDGFAGGMTWIGFGFLAIAGWLVGAETYALYSATIGLAALGFLMVNFPPARIFMGDAGSATLGLLAAAFSLWGIRDGLFAWWFPVLVFSPFVVDATITLMRRIINRERIWEAHRSHYYQQLVQSGWGHKKTVLAEYAVMILCGVSGLFAEQTKMPVFTVAVLAAWAIIYGVIAAFIHRHAWADGV